MSAPPPPPSFVPTFARPAPTPNRTPSAASAQWEVIVSPFPGPAHPQARPGPMPYGAYPPPYPGPRPTVGITLVGLAAFAQVLAVVVSVLGLTIPEGGAIVWLDTPAWAAFATLASFVQLAGLFGGVPATLWQIQVAGAGGLALAWAIIGIPVAASNHGFALTLGVVASVFGCWASGNRPTGIPRRWAVPGGHR